MKRIIHGGEPHLEQCFVSRPTWPQDERLGITWNNKDVHRPNALIIIGWINISGINTPTIFTSRVPTRLYNRSINYEERFSLRMARTLSGRVEKISK